MSNYVSNLNDTKKTSKYICYLIRPRCMLFVYLEKYEDMSSDKEQNVTAQKNLVLQIQTLISSTHDTCN